MYCVLYFTPRCLFLILFSVLYCRCQSWSSQTDDGSSGGASRSGYGIVPVQTFRPWCELKAVLLSLFSCCSLYSVQQHLRHNRCKVKTLLVHIGIILQVVTVVQVPKYSLIKYFHSSSMTCVMSGSRLASCFTVWNVLLSELTLIFLVFSPQVMSAWTAFQNIQVTCVITNPDV